MPLSKLHVLHVCNLHSKNNDTCRYLAEDSLKSDVYYCTKLTGQKKQIDEAVAEHMRNFSSDDERVQVADNCPGYPILHHAVVGYDQEKK